MICVHNAVAMFNIVLSTTFLVTVNISQVCNWIKAVVFFNFNARFRVQNMFNEKVIISDQQFIFLLLEVSFDLIQLIRCIAGQLDDPMFIEIDCLL